MADYVVQWKYGTVQTVVSSATDIAAGNFGGAGTEFTNNDAVVPNATHVLVMIECPDWAAAPVAGAPVEVWALPTNVDSTDDVTDAPATTASGGAQLLISFPMAAVDALQRRSGLASLDGIVSGFVPYVRNGTAQNMNNDGGTSLVVKMTPCSPMVSF